MSTLFPRESPISKSELLFVTVKRVPQEEDQLDLVLVEGGGDSEPKTPDRLTDAEWFHEAVSAVGLKELLRGIVPLADQLGEAILFRVIGRMVSVRHSSIEGEDYDEYFEVQTVEPLVVDGARFVAGAEVVKAARAARDFVVRRHERARVASSEWLRVQLSHLPRDKEQHEPAAREQALNLAQARAREHEAGGTASGVCNYLDKVLAAYDALGKKE